MANKLFGIADPQYDALRVLSNQALEAGASDSSIPPGSGGLLNKIYVWHADGSTIDLFDPDEAGVNAAYAAAVSGDTVMRPSIEIACTAAITIPAGVIDFPISDGAILSFSGFGGAAITLGTGSQMFYPIVRFVATGTDAIGIDAEADDCLVYEPDIEVSGGTATNHAINGGHEPIASEAWAMFHRTGAGHSIVWSDTFTFDSIANDTVWHVIESWPTGFDGASAGFMAMHYQANALYIARGTTIWSLTNLAAIRAAPGTTPSWAVIADNTTNVDGFNIISLASSIWLQNDVLCVIVRTSQTSYYYGEYTSGAWTWYAQGYDSTASQNVTYRISSRAYGGAIDTMRVYDPTDLSVYFDLNCGFGAGNSQPIWRNADPLSTDFVTLLKASAATTKIVDESGVTLHDTGLSVKNGTAVTGAQLGPQVYVVMQDGELFLSDDGATFTHPITWQSGAVLDNLVLGGGSLVWFRSTTADNGEAVHISIDRGATTHDKTGNLFSVISASALGLALCGQQLISPT